MNNTKEAIKILEEALARIKRLVITEDERISDYQKLSLKLDALGVELSTVREAII